MAIHPAKNAHQGPERLLGLCNVVGGGESENPPRNIGETFH